MTAAAATASGFDAIALHRDDDVATALHDLVPGSRARVRRDGGVIEVAVAAAIPLGHKFALRALPAGADIRKYGECIGAATAAIDAGAHVHVHNLKSRRARATS